jgi:hypothetical protein
MTDVLPAAQIPRGDAAETYAKRDNIGVPGASSDDTALTTVETNAAARETDRHVHNAVQGSGFAPDAADYEATGSGRGTAAG